MRLFSIILFSYCCMATLAMACDNHECIDLSDVEKHPIPLERIFNHFDKVALEMCKQSDGSKFRLSQPECISLTRKKIPACRMTINNSYTTAIHSKDKFKEIAHEYLDCIVPGIFCSGLEVKSEEMAELMCRDNGITDMEPLTLLYH